MDCRSRPRKSSDYKLNTLTECRESPTSSWENLRLTGADDPRHVLQANGGLADTRYIDDGAMLRHPILVPTCLLEFGVANAKFGAERNRLKTEVVCYVNDLNAAPPEWRIRDVQNMAEVSTAIAGGITLGVAVGPRQLTADQLLATADVIRAMHERVQLCQGPQTEFALLRESLGVSRTSRRNQRRGWTMVPRKALPCLHRRQHDAGHTQGR